jgi:formylglycine-generating enzyme
MATPEKNHYDVAISFAEEDVQAATAIKQSLDACGLSTYFYKDERASNWGENLFNVVVDRYKDTATFALVLISKDYVKKRWTNIERQIIQTVFKESGKAYLLPLKLDDTVLEGMTDNIIYEKWKNNPDEIARLIERKIMDIRRAQQGSEEKAAPAKAGDVIEVTSYDNHGIVSGKIETLHFNSKGS